MAIDSTRDVRRGLYAMLRADAPFTAIIPAAKVFGFSAPAGLDRPFATLGVPITTPIRAACVDGQDITLAVHLWTRARLQGQTVVESGEDVASRAMAAASAALDRKRLALTRGHAIVRLAGTRLLYDGEPDVFHGVLNLSIRCLTA